MNTGQAHPITGFRFGKSYQREEKKITFDDCFFQVIKGEEKWANTSIKR